MYVLHLNVTKLSGYIFISKEPAQYLNVNVFVEHILYFELLREELKVHFILGAAHPVSPANNFVDASTDSSHLRVFGRLDSGVLAHVYNTSRSTQRSN